VVESGENIVSVEIGVGVEVSLDESEITPIQFALHQNYPNPFNPHTEISFDIPEMTDINVSVFNLMGQKVKTLVNDNITPGYHTIMWDGTNDKGLQVSTGMYFYTLQSSEKRVMRKMLFLK
jgi:flagellar hook assembly protein FlgD